MTDQKARKRFKWIRDEFRNQTKKLEMGLQLSDKRLRWMESLSFLRNLKSRYRRPPVHNNLYGGIQYNQNDSNDDDFDGSGCFNNESSPSYNDLDAMYDSSFPPVIPIVSLDETDTILTDYMGNHNSSNKDHHNGGGGLNGNGVNEVNEDEHSMYSLKQNQRRNQNDYNNLPVYQNESYQQNHNNHQQQKRQQLHEQQQQHHHQQQQQNQQQQPKNQVTINLTANPEKNVTLGDFIDELIQQEPVELRERFMIEVMESFVQIKRQFLFDRINHQAK